MRVLPKLGFAVSSSFVLLALGCQATVDADSPSATPGAAGSASGGTGSLGGGGIPSQVGGSVALPPGSAASALLPARIRRLTVAEYQATVSNAAVIGSAADGISADFVPDSRQGGFTVNEAQRVDPVFAKQLAEAAATLAASKRPSAADRATCGSSAADLERCADSFIRSFGEKAYRRPLGDDEVTQLMTVFHTALEGGSYEEGIELAVRAMLQSAAFLYLTEIGDAPADVIKLTPYEVASSISYLVQGGPPSAELIDRAKSGALDSSEGRAALIGDPALGLFNDGPAATRVSRVIREWLGIDRVSEIAKDSTVYPDFAGARQAIADETGEFLRALVSQDGKGSVQQLLAADWAMASPALAPAYTSKAPSSGGFQRISTPDRLGILNQSAFLSVFAHAHETAPVLRGVAVMRRIACDPVGDPVNLDTAVVPPVPDPSKSTRERYSEHAKTSCASCHTRIDNYGFAFEQFDGMGRHRTDDNGPIDSSVVLPTTDFAGSYADSNALVKAMSVSPQVRQCFARQIFRAFAATSSAALQASEDDFVKYWDTTLARDAEQVKDVYIIDTIGAFLKSPSFNLRRSQ